MASCLRGSSFFRRRDSFEEEDVGGKGVVKKIPIEMKQRRTLATSLRSVGSFGPKRQKGASLRSALSVELDGQETEKVKKEFEMYRLNKENEIANLKKKEQKLENENRRLRGELQAMQKTVAKLLYEKDEACIDVQQALERAATFEAERDKIQRQFKIFREGKEEELQTILRTKRELERRLSSNRGRPGTGGGNNGMGPLNNIVETEVPSANHVLGDSTLPAAESSFPHGVSNHQHRNSVDWWMMGQSPCFDREPSLGSMTQLHTSMTMPGGYGGGGGMGGPAVHRKVSSTSSLFFAGRGGGGLGEGLGTAEVVSVSQFGTPTGLDVGDGAGTREEWMRLNTVGGGSLGQSRNSQFGYEPFNPVINDELHFPSSSVYRLYVSAPSDVQDELSFFQRRFVPRLQHLCARQGRTLLFLHLPPDELPIFDGGSRPPPANSDSSSPLESVDIEVTASLHSQLPKSSAIFLSFLHERLDTFTKDEIHYGYLQKRDDQLLGAVFCFRDSIADSAALTKTTTPSSFTTTNDDDFTSHRTCFTELTSLKTDIAEAEKFDENDREFRKSIFHVTSPEEAVEKAGTAVEALLRRSLGLPDNLARLLSDEEVEDEMDLVVDAGRGASATHLSPPLFDREAVWMTRLTASSGVDLLGDLEQEESLRQSLNSVCELGFESHYQELTNHLTSAGPLPPLLITGQPGTGKSLLLAKWLSLILEEKRTAAATTSAHTTHRSSAFYPHHAFSPLVLYHSVADAQSVSGNAHHALHRFTAKLLDHVPSSCASLGRITANPARLLKEFPQLLESVSSRLPGGVVLILDHADRFQDAEAQLSWLLDPLPVDLRVFVAADEECCPKSWKSWPTLAVESLSNNQIRELMTASFMIANKSLNPEISSLVQRHCRSPATTTPLYVSVLAAFLRWKSSFELELKTAVNAALENHNCVDLMNYALKEIDREYDGRICQKGTMAKVMALVSASRSGITLNDIFHVIGPLDDDSNVASGYIAWHRWSQIIEVLVETHVLRHRGGVLTFANPQAREAVRQVYLFSPTNLVDVRRQLIDYHRRILFRRDPRTVDELLWLQVQMGDWDQLRLSLRNIEVFVSLFSRGRMGELLQYWGVVVSSNDKISPLSAAYMEELKVVADAAEVGDSEEDEDEVRMTVTRVAAIYEALGRFFRNMACFDRASTALERALELRESLDPDCAEVGRSLVQLAQLNAEWRKYSTSEALFRNALELFEGLFGGEHAEVALALQSMALMYQRQGKHEIARPLQRRADSIKLKKRRERIEAARSQSAQQRKAEENDEVYCPTSVNLATNEALNLSTKPFSSATLPSSPKRSTERQKQIASTFFNHGVRLCQQNKHASAMPLFQGALAVFERALGPSHPLVAKTLRNLALVKYHLGDFEAAAKFYKNAIEMRECQNAGNALLSSPSIEELDRRRLETEVAASAAAKICAESRRSSSDTMSTVKVVDESFGHQRAASTR